MTARDVRRICIGIALGAVLVVSSATGAEAAPSAHHKASAHKSKAYERVPLSRLVDGKGGTFDSSTFTFRWVLSGHPGIIEDDEPTPDQILLSVTGHHCRSVHLDFAAGQANQSAWLGVRDGAKTVAGEVADYDEHGSVDARLRVGKPWTIAAATPASGNYVYVNGYADFYDGAGRWR